MIILMARRIKAAWFQLWRDDAPAIAPQFAPWTSADRDALEMFFRGTTGQRLLQRLYATEYRNAVGGARDVMHTVHSAGVSTGYSDCVKQIISLAQVCDAEPVEIKVTERDPYQELLERVSP